MNTQSCANDSNTTARMLQQKKIGEKTEDESTNNNVEQIVLRELTELLVQRQRTESISE